MMFDQDRIDGGQPTARPAAEDDPALDQAARVLKHLVTRDGTWPPAREELLKSYRREVARIVAATGATLPGDAAPPTATVDAGDVRDQLAAVNDRLERLGKDSAAVLAAVGKLRAARGKGGGG